MASNVNTKEMKPKAEDIVNEMKTKKNSIETKIQTLIEQASDVSQKQTQIMFNIEKTLEHGGSSINKIINQAKNQAKNLKKDNKKVQDYDNLSSELTKQLKSSNIINPRNIINPLLIIDTIKTESNELHEVYLQITSENVQITNENVEKIKEQFDEKYEVLNQYVEELDELNKRNLASVEEVTTIYNKLVKIANDLQEDMSGKTRELSIEEIMANIIKILSAEVVTNTVLTNSLIGDAVLNSITSRYTLEEVANGESMKDTTSNFSNEKGKFCDEHTDGGREVAGQVCVEVITQCLVEKTPTDCLKKWNGTDWSHGIEFSNVYKPVAEKLAIHLGLDKITTAQLVQEFNNNIDEHNKKNKKYTLKYLGEGIIKALRALEKTVNPVPDANKTTAKVAYIPMPGKNNNIFKIRSMLGGSNKNNSSDIAISYANFIRNTHALKNMVSMTGGGGNTEINENTIQVIRKTWTELATLMKSKGSSFSDNANKSFLSDVDSLERSFRRTKIITKYLEIVKQVFTDGTFIKYLNDLGVTKHTDIELSIVQKLVEKYNTSIKAGGKKLGNIVNTFSASANSVDLTEITKIKTDILESMKTMKESLGTKIDTVSTDVNILKQAVKKTNESIKQVGPIDNNSGYTQKSKIPQFPGIHNSF